MGWDAWCVGTVVFSLLCGYQPFTGTPSTLEQYVKSCQPNFGPEWDTRISLDAKFFVTSLLQFDIAKRKAAWDAALSHVWFTTHDGGKPHHFPVTSQFEQVGNFFAFQERHATCIWWVSGRLRLQEAEQLAQLVSTRTSPDALIALAEQHHWPEFMLRSLEKQAARNMLSLTDLIDEAHELMIHRAEDILFHHMTDAQAAIEHQHHQHQHHRDHHKQRRPPQEGHWHADNGQGHKHRHQSGTQTDSEKLVISERDFRALIAEHCTSLPFLLDLQDYLDLHVWSAGEISVLSYGALLKHIHELALPPQTRLLRETQRPFCCNLKKAPA